MQRLPDWLDRLHALVAAAETRAYAYGENDCGLWAAACVEAQTGVDFGAALRGRYTTAWGSLRALRRYGAGTLDDTVTAALGEPTAPLLVQRGDIVSDGVALGLMWTGATPHALFVGAAGDHDGLVAVPAATLVKGWRIE